MNQTSFEHAHGITTIDASYVRPGIAAMHMMVENGRAAFFDTGTTLSLPRVVEVMRAKGLVPESVDYVVPTHVHLDHAGGAGAMMQRFPRAQLVIHPRGAPHMTDPGKLVAGTVAVYGEEKTRALYGDIIPVPADRVLIADDGFELDFQGRLLEFVDTPGHARHHFCVIDRRHRGIFSGDTLGISYRVFDTARGPFLFPTTTPVQFEPEALHASIDRLMATDPQTLSLTHFGPVAASPRMIDDLHRHLREFVRIGLAAENMDADDREQALTTQVADYLFLQAREHGCRLSDREIRAHLAMDAKLNAQGIHIWLQRRSAGKN
jgi:glyoxylase-like metal-dependent hydrolase (beta-lactamase superfamily II)